MSLASVKVIKKQTNKQQSRTVELAATDIFLSGTRCFPLSSDSSAISSKKKKKWKWSHLISLPDSNPQELSRWDSALPPAPLLPRSSTATPGAVNAFHRSSGSFAIKRKTVSAHRVHDEQLRKALYFSEAAQSAGL